MTLRLAVLIAFGAIAALPARARAQGVADTAAVVTALADALHQEMQRRGDHHAPAVTGTRSVAPWMSLVRATLLARDSASVIVPATAADSVHALYLDLTTVEWRGDSLTMHAAWRNCSRRDSLMNFWIHDQRYEFTRGPDGWTLARRRAVTFADGHCNPAG